MLQIFFAAHAVLKVAEIFYEVIVDEALGRINYHLFKVLLMCLNTRISFSKMSTFLNQETVDILRLQFSQEFNYSFASKFFCKTLQK